jgi:hypothetical protein
MIGIIEAPMTKQEAATKPDDLDRKEKAVAIMLNTESIEITITESL